VRRRQESSLFYQGSWESGIYWNGAGGYDLSSRYDGWGDRFVDPQKASVPLGMSPGSGSDHMFFFVTKGLEWSILRIDFK